MPWREPKLMDTRTEFAQLALKKEKPFRHLCQDYGVSPKTGYKWLERYRQSGKGGMADRSRQPRSSPSQLEEAVVCRMVKLKLAHPHWGPKKIQALYDCEYGGGPSLSSFSRVLDKVGLVEKRKSRPLRRPDHRLDGVPPAEAPNEVWTVDFKGWWFIQGKRLPCQPLSVRDEYSRYILGLDALHTTRTPMVKRSFERLFAAYGMPKAIRSDNGAPFASPNAPLGLSRLSAWWMSLGIQLHRSRPGKPQDNGAHERMHRDIAFEIEAFARGNHRDHQVVFDLWREEYNHKRPHEALQMRRPAEFYKRSGRKYPGRDFDWKYPDTFQSRRVNGSGRIWVENQPLYLSNSLAYQQVGLKPLPALELEIYLASFCLARMELETRTIIWARPNDLVQLP